MLGRYAAARSTLDSLRPLFWGKYGLVLIGVVVGAGVMAMGEGVTGFVVVLVAFFLLAWLYHALEQVVRRTILRLGAHDRLAELDPIYDEMTDWQVQLRTGLRRAGSPLADAAGRSPFRRGERRRHGVHPERRARVRLAHVPPARPGRDARAILSRAAGPGG